MAHYPQLNIIDFETRHSTCALEVILNMIVSMGTFLKCCFLKGMFRAVTQKIC